jgi:hypothetical protein
MPRPRILYDWFAPATKIMAQTGASLPRAMVELGLPAPSRREHNRILRLRAFVTALYAAREKHRWPDRELSSGRVLRKRWQREDARSARYRAPKVIESSSVSQGDPASSNNGSSQREKQPYQVPIVMELSVCPMCGYDLDAVRARLRERGQAPPSKWDR